MDIQTIQLLALIFQGLAAAGTFSLLFIKPIRNLWLNDKKKRSKEQEECDAERESVKCLLRNDIVCIYFGNRERRSLHQYEYENLAMLYAAYKRMGGNSFVDRIWEEIQEWAILP